MRTLRSHLLAALAPLSCSLLLATTPPARAEVRPLTTTAVRDQMPQINNAGQVVWVGQDGAGTAVYLWSGGDARKVSTDTTTNRFPHLNDAGQVAWQGGQGNSSGVYLWDGTTTRRLGATVGGGLFPEIDSAGQVVWTDGKGPVYLWDGAAVQTLASGAYDSQPHITSQGLIVYGPPNTFGGFMPGRLSKPYLQSGSLRFEWPFADYFPGYWTSINNLGQLLWPGQHGLSFWNGSTIAPLSGGAYSAVPPLLNDAGRAVWVTANGMNQHGQVHLWTGTEDRLLTPTGDDYRAPDLNQVGQVVWMGRERPGADWEIYFWNGASVERLTDNSVDDVNPDLNDAGQVVWEERNGAATEILLYTPPVRVALERGSLVGGAATRGTVALDAPAPAGGAVVALTSSSPGVVSVPASITVPAGALQATFPVNTVAVPEVTAVVISAHSGGVVRASRLQVLPADLSFQLHLSELRGGNPSTATVTLAEPAPAGGAVLALTSDQPALAAIPASVTVPAGHTTAYFWVTTVPVDRPATVTLTATRDRAVWTEALRLTPAALASVSVLPGSVNGGEPASGGVTLDGPAPAGGALVTLASSDPAVVVPPAITVPAGAGAVMFPITTRPVDTPRSVTITGSFAGKRVAAVLGLAAPRLAAFTLDPDRVVGNTDFTATVTLADPAPDTGVWVTVTGTSPDVPLSARVLVNGGRRSATVSFRPGFVTRPTAITFTASVGNRGLRATLTVLPDIVSLSFQPAPIVGGQTTTGTISLRGPAPTGGAMISLSVVSSSNRPAQASVPAQVMVPAGQTAATFPVQAAPIQTRGAVIVTAAYLQQKVTEALEVVGDGVETVDVSQWPIPGGTPTSGTVRLYSPAPVGGAAVRMSSDRPELVVLPAQVTVPAGAMWAAFEFTTRPVASSTPVRIIGSYGGGSGSGTLTLLPAGLSYLEVANQPLTGGAEATGVIHMEAPVAGAPALVSLFSSDPTVIVPPTVAVPVGADAAPFPIRTTPVGAPVRLELAAAYRDQVRTTDVYVLPRYTLTLTLDPPSVIGGLPAAGTVTLNAPSPNYLLQITLTSSDPAIATTPGTLFIGGGSTQGRFLIVTRPAPTRVPASFTATLDDLRSSATLVVLPSPLASLRIAPERVPGGSSATGTVTLDGPASPGGLVVRLASDHRALAAPPASVRVPAGATQATFRLTTAPVRAAAAVRITVSLAGTVRDANVTVLPNASTAATPRRSAGRPRPPWSSRSAR